MKEADSHSTFLHPEDDLQPPCRCLFGCNQEEVEWQVLISSSKHSKQEFISIYI